MATALIEGDIRVVEVAAAGIDLQSPTAAPETGSFRVESRSTSAKRLGVWSSPPQKEWQEVPRNSLDGVRNDDDGGAFGRK